MKTSSITSCRVALIVAASALLLPIHAAGQTAPAPANPAKPAAVSDDLIMLTPFTVNTEKDTGFAATSSLAGGRLASDLRDTPAAYSVINRDFIDALNLTDLQSAQNWA